MTHAADPEVNDLYACQRLIKELRAELEKERAEHLDLLNPEDPNDWQSWRDSLIEANSAGALAISAHIDRLESRYSALVSALKQIAALEDGYVEDGKEAAQVLTIIGNIVQDALGALLDSEASDQGPVVSP